LGGFRTREPTKRITSRIQAESRKRQNRQEYRRKILTHFAYPGRDVVEIVEHADTMANSKFQRKTERLLFFDTNTKVRRFDDFKLKNVPTGGQGYIRRSRSGSIESKKTFVIREYNV